MKVRKILGVNLEMDDLGRVDISRASASGGMTSRSPSEWAKTKQCTNLVYMLKVKTGLKDEDLWTVVGKKRLAKTWVHPEIAELYLRTIGFGKLSLDEVIAKMEELEKRIASLEDKS